MQDTRDTSDQQQWTLADFLCTYRYWALFLAWLLVAVSAQSFSIIMPVIASTANLSYAYVGLYYSGSSAGWISGAFIAFVVAGRSARAALVWPMVICAILLAIFMFMPSMWGAPLLLILLGFSMGTVTALFPLATAVFLVGGRPGKIDFACAMALLSTALFLSFIGPTFASLFFELLGATSVLAAMLACVIIATLLIVPAGNLAFGDAPRQRHQPLAPRRRSPVMVAIILIAGQILWLALIGGAGFFGMNVFMSNEPSATALLFSLLLLVVSIGVVIYFLYWVYRIHGELAGAQASQRLVSPLPAMFIAILVPLGLPVLVMTLGELLNDRASGKGQQRPLSIGWLAFWAFCVPPIAMAMIQNAANGSYAESATGA